MHTRLLAAFTLTAVAVVAACSDGAGPSTQGSSPRLRIAASCDPAAVRGTLATLLTEGSAKSVVIPMFNAAEQTKAASGAAAAAPQYYAAMNEVLDEYAGGRTQTPKKFVDTQDAVEFVVSSFFRCAGQTPPPDLASAVFAVGVGGDNVTVCVAGDDVAMDCTLPNQQVTVLTDDEFFIAPALLIIEPAGATNFAGYPHPLWSDVSRIRVLPKEAQANYPFYGPNGKGTLDPNASRPVAVVGVCELPGHPTNIGIVQRREEVGATEPAGSAFVELEPATSVNGVSIADRLDCGAGTPSTVGSLAPTPLGSSWLARASWRALEGLSAALSPRPLHAAVVFDGGIGGSTSSFESWFVAAERSAGPTPGEDVVVFNDVNVFDDFALANENNQRLVRNLVAFTGAGPRSSAGTVVIESGHNSQYPRCFDTAAEAQMTGAGLTVVRQASTTIGTQPANVKVLILCLPRVEYGTGEINAMKSFAAEGGRIVFVGEHSGFYGSGIPIENEFLLDMGAVMRNVGQAVNCGYNTLPAASLRSHQITTGLTDLTIACASVVELGPNDYALFYDIGITKVLAGVAKVDVTPLPMPSATARRAGPKASLNIVAPASETPTPDAHTTTFSSRPFTKITFFASPVTNFAIPTSAIAAAIASSCVASGASVTVPRSLPFTCTASCTLRSAASAGSNAGHPASSTEPDPPSSSHSSSARCGANGATRCTSGATSARRTVRSPARSTFMYSIIAAIAVL